MDPNITRVNGVPYSWTSCSHFFAGLPYKGVKGVTFKETREVKLVHAAQQDGVPLGITSGIYKVENLSFTILRDSAAGLMADLALLSGTNSYGDCIFPYLLQVYEPLMGSTTPQVPSVPLSTAISGCRITGVEDKQELGSDELVTEFTCMAVFVIRNSGTLWSATRALL